MSTTSIFKWKWFGQSFSFGSTRVKCFSVCSFNTNQTSVYVCTMSEFSSTHAFVVFVHTHTDHWIKWFSHSKYTHLSVHSFGLWLKSTIILNEMWCDGDNDEWFDLSSVRVSFEQQHYPSNNVICARYMYIFKRWWPFSFVSFSLTICLQIVSHAPFNSCEHINQVGVKTNNFKILSKKREWKKMQRLQSFFWTENKTICTLLYFNEWKHFACFRFQAPVIVGCIVCIVVELS